MKERGVRGTDLVELTGTYSGQYFALATGKIRSVRFSTLFAIW